MKGYRITVSNFLMAHLGPPIPVYRYTEYRRKYGRYWYRYCTM